MHDDVEMRSDKMGASLEDRRNDAVMVSGGWSWRAAAACVVILLSAGSAAVQVSVTTSRGNNQRTNVNSNETILTPANVNTTSFGKLFSQPVDGYVFALPLYVANLMIG